MAYHVLKFLITPALVALLLSCCGGTNFDIYYNAELTTTAPLPKGQRARVINSMDTAETLARYKAEGYRIIGTMNLASERISNKEVADYATEKGASLVLVASTRTGSMQKSYFVPVTHTSTTYHNGTISALGTPTYNVSGASHTTQTELQQHFYSVGRYEYLYIFLAR